MLICILYRFQFFILTKSWKNPFSFFYLIRKTWLEIMHKIYFQCFLFFSSDKKLFQHFWETKIITILCFELFWAKKFGRNKKIETTNKHSDVIILFIGEQKSNYLISFILKTKRKETLLLHFFYRKQCCSKQLKLF